VTFNLTERVDRLGRTTTYEYDNLHRTEKDGKAAMGEERNCNDAGRSKGSGLINS